MRRFLSGIVLLVLAGASVAVAQQPAPQRAQNQRQGGSSPLFWSVDSILQMYVQTMAQHYNLSPEQQEYTRTLMNQRVKRFLADYEKDVRGLLAEIMDYQMKREIPPPEVAREIGERAKQLLPAIKHEILDGNMKWREILNDEQKARHDQDLQILYKQFDTFEQIADRWSKGEVASSDFEWGSRISQAPRMPRPSEDAWEYYVRMFIQMYNLDEGQRNTAYSVLRTMKEEAARYREAKKEEFARLAAADAEAAKSGPKSDPEQLKKAQEEARQRVEARRELEQPIAAMFERLKAELNKIPTSEQRAAREAKLQKLQALARGNTTRPATTSTAPAGTAQN